MNDPIVLVVNCDDHYTILLAALLKSIELNHKSNEKVIVYILEDGISRSNKKKLINSFQPEFFTFHWLSFTDSTPKGIKLPLDNSSWPLVAYGRLFIPHFIDSNIKRAIYLDVDMIVEDDISNLWQIDLKDNIAGAVQDPRVLIFNNSRGDGIKNHQDLGLDGNLKYFNAGILVIDVEKWKTFKVGEKVVETISNYMQFANFPDQYGLNIVLANNWYQLNSLWNHFSYIKSEEHPKLIHYIEKKPIYKVTTALPEYKDIFYKYLNQTEWKGLKSRSTTDIYINKARIKIIKKMKRLFRPLLYSYK